MSVGDSSNGLSWRCNGAIVHIVISEVPFLDERSCKNLILQPLTEIGVSNLDESLDTVNIGLEVNIGKTILGNYKHYIVLEHGNDGAFRQPGNDIRLGFAPLINICGAQAKEASNK